MKLYPINQAAKILGVSPQTLRRWEKEGKIFPQRTLGNSRRYSEKMLEEIKSARHYSKQVLEEVKKASQPKEKLPRYLIPSVAVFVVVFTLALILLAIFSFQTSPKVISPLP